MKKERVRLTYSDDVFGFKPIIEYNFFFINEHLYSKLQYSGVNFCSFAYNHTDSIDDV